jgi:ferredoxin-NADP reductase
MIAATGQLSALKARDEIAEGTMSFCFTKPADFLFRAGQSVDVTLLDPPESDAEGNTRAFSIASAPFEADLMVATRMRDTAFKRVLRNASLGTKVRLEGPGGSFVLHRKSEKPAVFLTGGIGVTPFLSMISQATNDKAPHQLYLFYSNRRPEDAAFLPSLFDAAKQNVNFSGLSTATCSSDIFLRYKGRSTTSRDRRGWWQPCDGCSPRLKWTKMIFVLRSFPATRNGRCRTRSLNSC